MTRPASLITVEITNILLVQAKEAFAQQQNTRSVTLVSPTKPMQQQCDGSLADEREIRSSP